MSSRKLLRIFMKPLNTQTLVKDSVSLYTYICVYVCVYLYIFISSMRECTFSYLSVHMSAPTSGRIYLCLQRVGPVFISKCKFWLSEVHFHICISFFLSSFASWCISLLISTFSSSAVSPMKWRWKITLAQFHDVKYHKSAILGAWEHRWAERMEIFQ